MGDHYDEQPSWPSIDDADVEALLAGQEVAPDLMPVAAVVGALKDAATRPAPPAPELAVQMAAGTFGHAGARQWRIGTGDGTPPGTRLAPLRAVNTPEDVEAYVRLAAKAASVGLAVALIGVGSAGFAGALPESAQYRFESVVESVTSYEFPEKTVGSCGLERDTVADGGAGSGDAADRVDDAAEAAGAGGPGRRGGEEPEHPGRRGGGGPEPDHGGQVSEQARGDGAEGRAASAQAGRPGTPAPSDGGRDPDGGSQPAGGPADPPSEGVAAGRDSPPGRDDRAGNSDDEAGDSDRESSPGRDESGGSPAERPSGQEPPPGRSQDGGQQSDASR